MKTFKQIREETEEIRREREERIRQGIPAQMGTYLSVGHYGYEPHSPEQERKAKEIIKNVYGIHPDEAPLPHLWAAGPHIKTEPGELVSIRPLINFDDTHPVLFPEVERTDEEIKRGVPFKYYVGGRVDHARKTISMIFGPIYDRVAPTRFSSSSLDRIAKAMLAKFPGYSLIDQTMDDGKPRVFR